MAFPPIPIYPKDYDGDYTLYVVHNTTEARLATDNVPWSQEVDIVAVASEKTEIWASNGFANIEGELFYYDSVDFNEDGKVTKLKGCSRQLGGNKTQFNKKGVWVRSYVVAEHHNQLVMSVLKTQTFIGYNLNTKIETLDWRIRNLRELDVIFDDFNCPDVNFTWNIIENDPVVGILAQYLIEITPPGTISSFRLDFGDGEFTLTDLQGQHRYAVTSRIDPVVRVSNDKCQIVQTPVNRENASEPNPEVNPVFEIPIPEIPEFPDYTFVPCTVPEAEFFLPPLIVPCISIEGQIGPIPSVIIGPNINLVSNVTITSTRDVQILHSNITITSTGGIPSIIVVDIPPIPATIVIDPPIPPTIVIVPPQSSIFVNFDATNMPMLEVDWGSPPQMEVAMTFARTVQQPQRFSTDENLLAEFGTEFADLFEVKQNMKVEYETVGIPSEIKVIMPDDMSLRLDARELDDRKIKIDASGLNIPSNIKIQGPDSPIPNSIRFDASDLVQAIELFKSSSPIKIDASGIPSSIKMEMEKEIPKIILVEMPNLIPSRIVVDSKIPDKIILEGPAGIPLLLPEEFVLPIKFPDKMPEVELVWRGSPIEIKITMDKIIDKEADGTNCVMIIPCKS